MSQDESVHKQHQWRRNNQVSPAHTVQGDILDIDVRDGRRIMVQHIKPAVQNGCGNNDAFENANGLHLEKEPVRVKCDECLSENIVLDQIIEPQGNQQVDTSTSSRTCPVIFFIHGVGGSAKLWQHQVEYFSQGDYEIVVPDLLGHGLSSAPKHRKAYTFTELANDMLALFDKFAKEDNILVGHSYGSSFCVKIANERSEQVSRVILISGGGPQSLQPQPCQIFCLPSCILSCIKPIIVNGFIKRAFKYPTEQAQLDKDNSFNAPARVLHAMMNGQDWQEGNRSYHAKINAPMLLIYGMHDQFISIDEEYEMEETIHDCRLETVETGHMVMLEAPEKVNNLIHDFIHQEQLVAHDTLCTNYAQ